MEVLNSDKNLGEFFERLSDPRPRALLLDYDGTLAPFVVDRRRAVPYPGVRDLLARIAGARKRTHLAVVSGRPLNDLPLLLGVTQGVELWGSHGLERRNASGCWVDEPSSREETSFLTDVASWTTSSGWGELLEKKPHGFAIHSRGIPPERFEEARREVLERWGDRARGLGLEVMEFDGGIELRPSGAHKGRVIEKVASELGRDASIAYLGDDTTDEDAFRALGPRGVSVLVRPEKRPTAADAWIRPPDELLHFLARWQRAVEG